MAGYGFAESSSSKKPSSWIPRILNKISNDKLYDSHVTTQEFHPNPNWELPHIAVEKIYDLPFFQFRVAFVVCFISVNVPISLTQPVYQILLIKQEDINWGLQHGYKYIHLRLT